MDLAIEEQKTCLVRQLCPLDVLDSRLVVVGICPPSLKETDLDILFSIRSKPRHDCDHGSEEI